MGYKPKYAASSRKREPDVIRTKPEPEKKPSRPKKAQSKAGRIFPIILTVILVPVCTYASVRLLHIFIVNSGSMGNFCNTAHLCGLCNFYIAFIH